MYMVIERQGIYNPSLGNTLTGWVVFVHLVTIRVSYPDYLSPIRVDSPGSLSHNKGGLYWLTESY